MEPNELSAFADVITFPRHYMGNGEVECMDAMESMMYGADVDNYQAFWWGAAFKYIWRWPWKNKRQDIEKAIRCLTYILRTMEDDDEDV